MPDRIAGWSLFILRLCSAKPEPAHSSGWQKIRRRSLKKKNVYYVEEDPLNLKVSFLGMKSRHLCAPIKLKVWYRTNFIGETPMRFGSAKKCYCTFKTDEFLNKFRTTFSCRLKKSLHPFDSPETKAKKRDLITNLASFLTISLLILLLFSPSGHAKTKKSSGKGTLLPDLFTGAVSYSIPIGVPPGRGGVHPEYRQSVFDTKISGNRVTLFR